MRKHVGFAAQLTVTAALLLLLFRDFEWHAFWGILGATPVSFYVLSFAAVLFGQMLYAWRWRLVLVALGIGAPYREVLRQYLIGVFFNNFLPSTMGGDWAKVYYLGRHEGYIRVGASILADRLIGLFWLAALSALLLWFVDVQSAALAAARSALTLVAAGLAMMVIAAATLPVSRWCAAVAGRWKRLELPADGIRRLLEHVHDVARRPAVLIGSSATVVVYFVILGVMYRWFFTRALGASPDLLTVTAVVAAIATLANIPIAVNGLGLREQLHLVLLGAFGVSREAAAGISLLLFAHVLGISAVGAVAWLRRPRTPVDLLAPAAGSRTDRATA